MKNRIDDIEVLRAIAVIYVAIEHMNVNLFHWETPAMERFFTYFGGWTGVDLFFAISGFVIARDLLPRLQASDSREQYITTTISFWVRRFWRLIPSAWLWLLIIMLGVIFFNDSNVWSAFRYNFQTVVSALLHVANLHLAMVFGNEPAGAAMVYWSLSLEEQFYLLLPFIVLLSGRWLPHVLGVIILLQMANFRETLYPVLMRTDALFLGVLLAIWSKNQTYRLFEPVFLNNRKAAVIVLGVLLLPLATIGSDDLKITHFRFALIAIVSIVLVFIASYDRDYLIRNPVLKRIFLWFGTRSYAIYLIHMPSYFMTREIWFRLEPTGTRFNADYTWQFLLTAVALLLILSELNYRFVETPLRRHGANIANNLRDRPGNGATAETGNT